jgi:hypothetical protein
MAGIGEILTISLSNRNFRTRRHFIRQNSRAPGGSQLRLFWRSETIHNSANAFDGFRGLFRQ